MSRGQKRAVIWAWATDCLRRSAVKSRPGGSSTRSGRLTPVRQPRFGHEMQRAVKYARLPA